MGVFRISRQGVRFWNGRDAALLYTRVRRSLISVCCAFPAHAEAKASPRLPMWAPRLSGRAKCRVVDPRFSEAPVAPRFERVPHWYPILRQLRRPTQGSSSFGGSFGFCCSHEEPGDVWNGSEALSVAATSVYIRTVFRFTDFPHLLVVRQGGECAPRVHRAEMCHYTLFRGSRAPSHVTLCELFRSSIR